MSDEHNFDFGSVMGFNRYFIVSGCGRSGVFKGSIVVRVDCTSKRMAMKDIRAEETC